MANKKKIGLIDESINHYKGLKKINNYENLESFIDYYKEKILSKLKFLDESESEKLAELLYNNSVLSKSIINLNIDNLDEENSGKIIDTLKVNGTTNLDILIKPKSLISDSNNNILKYYYNTESLALYNSNTDLFFENTEPYYRKYSIEKLQDFIDSNDNKGFKNIDNLIKTISGIIEFPKDYLFLMLKFFKEKNILKIGDDFKINYTKLGKEYYGIYSELSDENGFIEIGKKLQTFIMDSFKEDSKITPLKVKNKIKKNFGTEVNLKHIKLLKDAFDNKKDDNLDSLYNMNLFILESEKKFNIVNNNYIFTIISIREDGEKIKKDFSISIEQIDEIFYLYSEYGQNLTQNEVLEYTRIKPELWNIIKSRLRILKKSDIFGPHTMKLFGDNEHFREKKIQEITEKYIRDKTRKELKNKIKKEDDKLRKKSLSIITSIESLKLEFSKILNKTRLDPNDFKLYEQLPENNNDEITFLFSDIHIGKKGQKDIEVRLNLILNNAIKSPESVINIMINGDIFETLVQDGMHSGQINHLDGGNFSPFELFMYAQGIFRNFLIELVKHGKQVRFFGIPGNHDRVSQNKAHDLERFGGLLFYEMLKQLNEVSENVLVDYGRGEWHNFEAQGMNYILHHGDNGQVKNMRTKAEKIVVENSYLTKRLVNLIIMGDQHNLQIGNPSYNIATVLVPALGGKGSYDTMLGLSSNPGYLTIKAEQINNEVMPIISNHFLPDKLQINQREKKSTNIFSNNKI